MDLEKLWILTLENTSLLFPFMFTGANYVEDEFGNKKDLSRLDEDQRVALVSWSFLWVGFICARRVV